MTKRYPINEALDAIGWQNAKRVQHHRQNGDAFAFAEVGHGFGGVSVDQGDHMAPVGWGAGAKVHFSLEAIVQTAIALRMIDGGCPKKLAYEIGATFVFLGEINSDAGTAFGGDEMAPSDPILDRPAGRLFAKGETWLVYSISPVEAHEEQYAYFSDLNPGLRNASGRLEMGRSQNFVGSEASPSRTSPIILLNVSRLVHDTCVRLGVDPTQAFGWGGTDG